MLDIHVRQAVVWFQAPLDPQGTGQRKRKKEEGDIERGQDRREMTSP